MSGNDDRQTHADDCTVCQVEDVTDARTVMGVLLASPVPDASYNLLPDAARAWSAMCSSRRRTNHVH